MTKRDLVEALQNVDDDTELLVTVGREVSFLMLGQSALKYGAIAVQVLPTDEETSSVIWD